MDGIYALIVMMFLVFFLGFFGGVFFSILNIWSRILQSKWRFLAYIVSLVMVFFLCVGDELIERHQLERICQKNNSDRLVLSVAKKLQGKNLIDIMELQPDIPTITIFIKHYKATYKDAKSGEIYFVEDNYYQNNGWYIKFLKNLTGMEWSEPLIPSNNCPHSLSEYKKEYGFRIVRTILTSK